MSTNKTEIMITTKGPVRLTWKHQVFSVEMPAFNLKEASWSEIFSPLVKRRITKLLENINVLDIQLNEENTTIFDWRVDGLSFFIECNDVVYKGEIFYSTMFTGEGRDAILNSPLIKINKGTK